MTDAERAMVERIERRAAERLLAVAVAFQAEAKKDYSRRSNPFPHDKPSKPGQWPAGRTWNLRDSIAVDPPTVAGIVAAGLVVRVGVLRGAYYGAILTAKGWRGLKDTLARVRGRLARIGGTP